MTDAARPLRNPPHERVREIPISLIRGGSFYKVQEKAGLIQPHAWNLNRRVPIAVAIAWLPLVVLAVIHGGVEDLRALLVDYRVYARVFVAIPLLLVAQVAMDLRFREMAQHFLDANLVRGEDLSRFREIMQKTRRLRDARLPEVLAILAVYAQVGYLLESGRLAYASWAVDSGSLTPAGYYSMLVTQALFLLLGAIAFWKWMIWVYVLWRISRLRLQLDATNGDLTAGLGFLAELPRAFVPVIFALSAVIGGNWRTQVLTGQVALEALAWPAAVLAVIVLVVFFLPLTLFSPALVREKRVSARRYGAIRHQVSLRFHRKWLNERNNHADDLLDGPDVSSLADISTSFQNVDQMRLFPFRKGAAIAILVALALPLIPVLTTRIPLSEVMKHLLQAVA